MDNYKIRFTMKDFLDCSNWILIHQMEVCRKTNWPPRLFGANSFLLGKYTVRQINLDSMGNMDYFFYFLSIVSFRICSNCRTNSGHFFSSQARLFSQFDEYVFVPYQKESGAIV